MQRCAPTLKRQEESRDKTQKASRALARVRFTTLEINGLRKDKGTHRIRRKEKTSWLGEMRGEDWWKETLSPHQKQGGSFRRIEAIDRKEETPYVRFRGDAAFDHVISWTHSAPSE